jgi:hypothetical protein
MKFHLNLWICPLKGAAPRFSSEGKESLLSEILRFCQKLRGYNNYSHQIAFEMEETQVKIFVYKHKRRGVC